MQDTFNEICDPQTAQAIDLREAIARHSGDHTAVYKTVGGEALHLSWYFPPHYAPERRKYPVFFFVHGGGWTGRKIFADQTQWAGDYLGFLARYYANMGFVSVSIDYRLIREQGQTDGYALIDLYEDCMDALAFAAAHAREYGLECERAVVLGESAGGYLAAAIAAFPYRKNPFRLRLSVLVNPITSLSDVWARSIPAQSSHPLLRGRTQQEKLEALSPIYQIGKSTCEALVIHGLSDTVVLGHHAQDYQAAMRRAGGKAQILWLTDTTHAFLLEEYSKQHQAAYAAIARIDAAVEGLASESVLSEQKK